MSPTATDEGKGRKLRPSNSKYLGYNVTLGHIGKKLDERPAEWIVGKIHVLWEDSLGTVEEAAAKGDRVAQWILETKRKRGIDVSRVPFIRRWILDEVIKRGPPLKKQN